MRYEETVLYPRTEGECLRKDKFEESKTWRSSHWAGNLHPQVYRCGNKSAVSSVGVQWACMALGIPCKTGCFWRAGAF